MFGKASDGLIMTEAHFGVKNCLPGSLFVSGGAPQIHSSLWENASNCRNLWVTHKGEYKESTGWPLNNMAEDFHLEKLLNAQMCLLLLYFSL